MLLQFGEDVAQRLDDWSDELSEQWGAAYRAISGLMKEGARNAQLMAAQPQASEGLRPTT